MSNYTETVQRLCAILRASSRTIGMTDDVPTQRRALAELATWLRILGFKADYRMDRLRVFGQDLWFSDDLWFYNGAVGSRNVAVELTNAGETAARRPDDEEMSCACWQDGTRLTKAELRAWLRA